MTAEHEGTVEVTDFTEVREAWKCPHLSAETGGAGDEHFRAGTVLRLDGDLHRRRRRAMARILSRGGHKYFRDKALFPTVDAGIEELLRSPDADGFARVNVTPWARRINQQLAAAIVGFDAATTPEGGQQLYELLRDWMEGRQGAFANTFEAFDEEGEAQKRALRAIRVIKDEFYRPAYERRDALAVRHRAGEIAFEELPSDLLMLMALREDPAWEDADLRQRESIFVLGAGVHTTAFTLVWTLEELFIWLDDHPEDRSRVEDDEFLKRVMEEALRLHPVVPGFSRRATADVILEGKGTVIADGNMALIRNGPPALQRDVFGVDAAEFNPYRDVPPGVQPHAYAFGAGPHMCYGAPLVMGAQGVDGSLFYLLKSLVRAGAEPDPEKPRLSLAGTRGRHSDAPDGSYYLRFAVRGVG